MGNGIKNLAGGLMLGIAMADQKAEADRRDASHQAMMEKMTGYKAPAKEPSTLSKIGDVIKAKLSGMTSNKPGEADPGAPVAPADLPATADGVKVSEAPQMRSDLVASNDSPEFNEAWKSDGGSPDASPVPFASTQG